MGERADCEDQQRMCCKVRPSTLVLVCKCRWTYSTSSEVLLTFTQSGQDTVVQRYNLTPYGADARGKVPHRCLEASLSTLGTHAPMNPI